MKIASCLVLVLLAACSAPGRGARRNPPAAAEQRQAVSVPRQVLAEAVCQAPKVRVQVIEVARSGPESITVKFRFVNSDAAAPVAIGQAFADAGTEMASLTGVYVLDAAGQKKTFVLRDEAGRPQCSTGLGAVPPGGQVDAWARYPVPSLGVGRVTVQVPGVPAFRDLPVTEPAGGTGAARPSY